MTPATIEAPLLRYYIYKFLTGIGVATTSFFFTFFYTKGYPVHILVLAILTYAVTCLVVLPFFPLLISVLGLKKVFRLYTLVAVCKIVVLYVLVETNAILLFVGYQFFHGLFMMFMRIPLEHHFCVHGTMSAKGRSIALEQNLLIIAGALGGALAGYILDHHGVFYWEVLHICLMVIAAFVIDIEEKQPELLSMNIMDYNTIFPTKLKQSLFLTNIFYPFTRDLLPLWIIINLGSFTLGAAFLYARFIVSLLLNSAIGKLVDARRSDTFYVSAVLLSALFYLVIPFFESKQGIVWWSFTLGLFAIAIEIPFRRNFYWLSENSQRPIECMIFTEVIVQASILCACMVALGLLLLIPAWQYLLMLGALSSLAFLYLRPKHVDEEVT